MSLHHFFLESQTIKHEDQTEFFLQLSRDDIKHARVIRLKEGEHISVVDAVHDYFECEIVSFDEEGLCVRIVQELTIQKSMAQVYLVQGIAKGDKMDDIIRHTTEVGLAGFIPLICNRSIVKLDAKKSQARMTRWKTIAKSASMQSGRLSIPEIYDPLPINQIAPLLADMDLVLICWEEHTCGSIHEALEKVPAFVHKDFGNLRIAVVVGPEGGLTSQEIQELSSCAPCEVVTLGSTILRTETAGIVAPSLVLYECGGLGNSL